MAKRHSDTKIGQCFLLIDPLRPPVDSEPLGRLATIISACATWYFAAPITDRDNPPVDDGTRRLEDIVDAIEVAHELLRADGALVEVSYDKRSISRDRRGYQLVDHFCNQHMQKKKAFSHELASGRMLNQRQLLCAMALYQAEQAARAVAIRDVSAVCDLMEDILELVCEIRRALDREAGSSIAARRARQRHEIHDRIKCKAYELYDQQEWRSARKAAQSLFKKVHSISKELGEPLSEDSGELTLCKWFRTYRNSMRAQQA